MDGYFPIIICKYKKQQYALKWEKHIKTLKQVPVKIKSFKKWKTNNKFKLPKLLELFNFSHSN